MESTRTFLMFKTLFHDSCLNRLNQQFQTMVRLHLDVHKRMQRVGERRKRQSWVEKKKKKESLFDYQRILSYATFLQCQSILQHLPQHMHLSEFYAVLQMGVSTDHVTKITIIWQSKQSTVQYLLCMQFCNTQFLVTRIPS